MEHWRTPRTPSTESGFIPPRTTYYCLCPEEQCNLRACSTAVQHTWPTKSSAPSHEAPSLAITAYSTATAPSSRPMRAMQTLSNAQRSEKKRPAVETSNPPPTAAAPEPTSQIQSGARTSSGSSRSSTYRKANVCLMAFPFTCWIVCWIVVTSFERAHMTDMVTHH